jgi:hypothetical protein
MASVYMGIDVACAIGKRLPICVVSPGRPLTPLVIPKHLAAEIPRGVGNKEIKAAAPFEKAAREVVGAIRRIEIEMGWRIERLAVDAPAAPPEIGARKSEIELGHRKLSSFRTPDRSGWAALRQL